MATRTRSLPKSPSLQPGPRHATKRRLPIQPLPALATASRRDASTSSPLPAVAHELGKPDKTHTAGTPARAALQRPTEDGTVLTNTHREPADPAYPAPPPYVRGRRGRRKQLKRDILNDYPQVEFDTMALKTVDRYAAITEEIEQRDHFIQAMRSPIIRKQKRDAPVMLAQQKAVETQTRLMLAIRAYAESAAKRGARPITLERYVEGKYSSPPSA